MEAIDHLAVERGVRFLKDKAWATWEAGLARGGFKLCAREFSGKVNMVSPRRYRVNCRSCVEITTEQMKENYHPCGEGFRRVMG